MNLFLISGLILSALIGLSLGLVGGGGSIITVPVLVYVLGVEAHEAVGMSLTVVGATSLVGAGSKPARQLAIENGFDFRRGGRWRCISRFAFNAPFIAARSDADVCDLDAGDCSFDVATKAVR